MKTFVLTGAAFVLLVAASAAAAETGCRDFRKPLKQTNESSVIAVDRSLLPSVRSIGNTFDERSPTDTFAIKGTLCDGQLSPLGGKSLRVVLVERQEDATDGALPADAITSGMVRTIEAREVVTSPNGKFLVTGLVAGEYVLEVDWEDLSEAEYVVFDLRHIPGPPLRSSVEQVGLIKP